ncbi:MAG: methylmalonyl Co-A mutase-associated GTPase MeaB [candidate division WOR-3 bacterium]
MEGKELTIKEYLKRFEEKDERALSKIITIVEEEQKESKEILDYISKRVGKAYRIGITGPQGSGKSTLIAKLTKRLLNRYKEIGIIACDPSSPFSYGALLGDRIRMTELFLEKGVFIRSMATRGSLNGLAYKTKEVADILDAFGKEIILIETIGVGQVEVEISNLVDTTIVVFVPESGDGIQILKAGLTEIGDIFVINKSDRIGADILFYELKNLIEMSYQNSKWKPPVILTQAVNNYGIEELEKEIINHYNYLIENNILEEKRKKAIIRELITNLETEILKIFWQNEKVKRLFDEVLKEVLEKKLTIEEGVKKLIKEVRYE